MKKLRLDKWLATKEELSRTTIVRLLEEGNILVNGKKVKPSYDVKEEDEIIINKPELKETKLEAEDIPVEIVYEDDDMLVVNKPKGMVVHPGI